MGAIGDGRRGPLRAAARSKRIALNSERDAHDARMGLFLMIPRDGGRLFSRASRWPLACSLYAVSLNIVQALFSVQRMYVPAIIASRRLWL